MEFRESHWSQACTAVVVDPTSAFSANAHSKHKMSVSPHDFPKMNSLNIHFTHIWYGLAAILFSFQRSRNVHFTLQSRPFVSFSPPSLVPSPPLVCRLLCSRFLLSEKKIIPKNDRVDDEVIITRTILSCLVVAVIDRNRRHTRLFCKREYNTLLAYHGLFSVPLDTPCFRYW